jgi:predicted  nucleic acid-binding Zn-ribbon protein
LKEQLKLLIEVQRHDARIQELDGMMKVFPQKLEEMRVDLRRVEQMLEREKAQLAESEAWRKRQEDQMKDEEAQLLKAKQKSSLVKNAKEMMANERELQQTRKTAQERQEEVLKLVEAVETAKKSIAQHEGDLEALRKHVGEEEAAAKGKVGEIEGQIVEERKLREVAAARVRPDMMKRYSSIRMRRGLALVPVRNGTCQGCNMNIPPQLFNLLQRGNSVELCSTCHRMIYWDKMLEDPDGTPSEPSAK